MQNLGWKIVLILFVLGVCVYSIIPPSKTIRLGKDLRGGVSLVYTVDVPDTADSAAVILQVIDVLKERVNPQGTFDISFMPLGLDRIEIVMPLPNEAVQGLRQAYEARLEVLLSDAMIPPSELDRAVRLGQAVTRFGGEGERGAQIVALQDAYEYRQIAEQRYREAQQQRENGEISDEDFNLAESAVAQAEDDYDDLRRNVLRMSLERSRLVRALQLSNEQKPKIDPTTGEQIVDEVTEVVALEPSQRQVALASLETEFPHLRAQLEELTEAYDEYQGQRTGFDDPEDLKRLLRGAGVLDFRIAVMPDRAEGVSIIDMRTQLAEVGPDNTDSNIARWFPINDLEQWYDNQRPEQLASMMANPSQYFAARALVGAEHQGQLYLLLYTTPAKSMTHQSGRDWGIEEAYPTADQLGRPAVGFDLGTAGGVLMSRLTGPHVQQPMAIVLDGQVYTAPNLNSQITNSGIIQGTFSPQELSYLIRVLNAGSLGARMSAEPVAVNTLGPSIGADNLKRGMDAFLIALIAVAVFMLLYYFFAGAVADFALLCNGLIIFGVMAAIDGTFTLPGLAGLVLTIGMAVDANVLIYERIREELFSGEVDLKAAIREGYRKAFSTIIDANVTNLIVCLVLFKTATAEVKGFALTLTIGICATLFTALFVTRVIYVLYTDVFKFKSLPMLPTVVPSIHRALEPTINWIRMRGFFWTVSGLAIIGSVLLIGSRGADLFDTEFRGGVSVTMQMARVDPDQRDGPRLMLSQALVEQRIHSIGDGSIDLIVPDMPVELVEQVAEEFSNAAVLTIGETGVDESGAVTASEFQVKVSNPKGLDDETAITDVVVALVVDEFNEQLDVTPSLRFAGLESDDYTRFTHLIGDGELGKAIGQPRYNERIDDYLGGVAIVVEGINPPVTTEDVAQRVLRMRQQPDFAELLGRNVEVFGLEPMDPSDPSKGFDSMAIVVFDPDLSALKIEREVWEDRVAKAEWQLVSTGLRRQSSLEQVSSYSSAIAQTLSAQATVAVVLTLLGILVYIWIRFGSFRYSLAAIVALVHDVTIALGVLASTAFISTTAIGMALGIADFRIDLGVVAALLTIIGYSLNDTIVILDRIRENRGKRPLPTAPIVNRSINQTISRTLLTSFTTLLAVAIMYRAGGTGIRPFTFCLLVGLIIGTYSSIAIAAPLVFKGKGESDAEERSSESAQEHKELAAGVT
jgi:SecD/SecF fusion protein